MRLVALLALSALLAEAPLQCSHETDPELRRYETPPEALHDLALRFKAKGETGAYQEALRYLIERYPSSRFAERAKQELSGEAPDEAAFGGAGAGGK